MPTITTTVTSACASGAVTTQTTTEATPDTGAPTNSASETVAAMIGEWGAGTLPQSYPKYWSPSVTIHAGPGKVTGWGSYTFDTFAGWLDILTRYNFNDMTSAFYPRQGGAVWEWSVSSLERKSDGKKCKGFHAVNLFDLDANNMITDLKLIFDFSIVEEAFSDSAGHCEAMVGAWAQGKLFETRKTWFAESLEVDAGSSTKAPGFKQYTMATFENWTSDMEVYDFHDMSWTFFPSPTGAVGVWTVSSLSRKETGKGTGPMKGVNHFTMEDGKITKVEILNSKIGEVEALF